MASKAMFRGGKWTSAIGRLTAAGFCLCGVTAATAGPQGGQVVHGQAEIQQQGARTEITASDNAVINFEQYNIAQSETVQYIQPSASARVLNRVLGGSASRINGTLTANGHVYIANPSGVFFGNNAVVDTAGLTAAAANISNQDFLQSVDLFQNVDGNVFNAGTIRSQVVNLVGEQVKNTGSIIAPDGMVTLASGKHVMLRQRDGSVMVKLERTDGGSQNGDSGEAAVANEGTIDTGSGGQAKLAAGDVYSLAVKNGGDVRGEQVVVSGETGRVEVSGNVDASSDTGDGGRVEIIGDEIALYDTRINASGATGGGTILIGGDVRGGGETPTASSTFVGSEAIISADATQSGSGGKVVVWADGATGFYGSISAVGADGASGGFVETSGKQYLDAFGGEVVAPGGTWLLDPTNIAIRNGAGDGESNGNTTFDGNPSGNTGQIVGSDTGPTEVFESELEGIGSSVNILLEATNDITVDDLTTADGNTTLDLQTGTGQFVAFQADADNDGSGAFTMNDAANDSIITQGGAVVIQGASIDVGAIDTSGGSSAKSVSLTADNNVTVRGAINTGTLNLTATAATVNGAVTADPSSTVVDALDVDVTATTVFNDTVTLNSGDLRLDGGGGGAAIRFNANTDFTGDELITAADNYRVELLGTSNTINPSAGPATFTNTGGVQFGDASGDQTDFPAGLDTTGVFGGTDVAGTVTVGDDATMVLRNATLQAAATLEGGGEQLSGGTPVNTLQVNGSIAGNGFDLTLSAADGTGNDGRIDVQGVSNVGQLTVQRAVRATFHDSVVSTADVLIEDITASGNDPAPNGTVTFEQTVSAGTSFTADTGGTTNNFSVELLGGGTINGASFQNVGGLVIGNDGGTGGDVTTFPGGLDTGTNDVSAAGVIRTDASPIDVGTLTLTGETIFDTTDNGASPGGSTVGIAANASNTETVSGGGNALTVNGGTGGDVTLGDGGDNAFTNLASVDADGDNLNIEGPISVSGDLVGNAQSNINLAAGAVQTATSADLLAAGAIVDSTADGSTNVTATDASLEAQTGIGSGDTIELAVGTLDLRNVSSGAVDLANDGGLVIDDLGVLAGTRGNLGGGTTTIVANSPQTISTDVTFTGNTTLTASPNAGATGDDFTIDNATVTLDDAASITLDVNAGDSIAFASGGTINSTGGGAHVVNLTADTEGNLANANEGTITQDTAGTSVTAAELSATAPNGVGSSGQSFTVDVNDLSADSSGNNGDQFLQAQSGLTALDLNAGGGDVVLSVAGSIADADGSDDLQASDATLLADGGIGAANALNTAVTNLDLVNTTGGAVNISNTGALTLDDLDGDSSAVSAAGSASFVTDNSDLAVDDPLNAVGATLDAGTASVTSRNNGTIAAGSGALTVVGDEIDLDVGAGSVSGTGAATLRPETASAQINVGSAADNSTDNAGQLDLTDEDLAALADGFASITVGDSGSARTIEVDADDTGVGFSDPLTLVTDASSGGEVLVRGDMTGSDNASLTIDTFDAVIGRDSETTTIDVVTPQGITLTTASNLGLVVENQDTANLETTGAGTSITINGTINGDNVNPDPLTETLTASAPVGGTINATGPVGGGADGAPSTSGDNQPLNINFAGGTITIPAGDYGPGDPVFSGDTINFPAGADSILGSGNFTVQTFSPGRDIGIENVFPSSLQITQANLDAFADGFASLTIGRADGSGTMRINSAGSGAAVTVRDPLFLRMPNGDIVVADADAGGGSATLSQLHTGGFAADIRTKAPFSADPLEAGLTFLASPNTTTIAGRIDTDGTPIEYLQDVRLAGDTVLATTGTLTTGDGSFPNGAFVAFRGSLGANNQGADALTILAGDTGDVSFEGAVGNGGAARLGPTNIGHNGTDQTQDFGFNSVTAEENFFARSLDIEQRNVAAGGSGGTGSVVFNAELNTAGFVNGSVANSEQGGGIEIGGDADGTPATIEPIADVVRVDGPIDSSGRTDGAGIGQDGGNVRLDGSSVIVNAIATDGGNSISGNNNGGNAGDITLDAHGATDPTVTLNRSLSAVGGNGAGTGSQGDGGAVRIGDDATGGTDLDGLGLGTQPVTVTTGGAATPGDVTFDGDFDGNSVSLTVNAGGGDVAFLGGAGNASVTPLVDNFSAIDVSSANNVSFNGDPADVGDDADDVDVADVGSMSFDITGDLVFEGQVGKGPDGAIGTGDDAPIGSITVTNATDITFDAGFLLTGQLLVDSARDVTVPAGNDVEAGSIDQNAGTGLTSFGGTVTTTGNQGIEIATSQITFSDDVTANSGGPVALTNSGQLTIANGIDVDLNGGGSFTQGGGGPVDLGGDVFTEAGGGVQFGSPVTLTADVEIDTDRGQNDPGAAPFDTGDITFLNTIDATASENLTLDAGAGAISVTGAVGAFGGGFTGQDLTDLRIVRANDVEFLSTVEVETFTQEAGVGAGPSTLLADDVNIHAAAGATGIEINTPGTLTFGDSADGDDEPLTLVNEADALLTVGDAEFLGGAGSIRPSAAPTDTAVITVQPNDAGGNMTVGSGGAGGVALSNTDVNALAEGFARIFLGRAAGTGTIAMGNGVTFKDPLFVRTPGSGGTIDIVGAVSGNDDATLAFDATDIRLGSEVTTAGNDVFFIAGSSSSVGNPPGALGGDLAVVTVTNAADVNTTDGGGAPAGANIFFEDTIEGDGGTDPLTLNAGTGGNALVGVQNDGPAFTPVPGATGTIGAIQPIGGLTLENANNLIVLGAADVGSYTQDNAQTLTNFRSTLTAAGPIQINDAAELAFDDTVTATSYTQSAGRGDVTFSGTPSLVTSAAGRAGGDISVALDGADGTQGTDDDGTLTAAGAIDASGGARLVPGDGFDGGGVEISAGDVIVRSIDTGGADANTNGSGGNAGSITLDATDATVADITLHGDLTATGGLAAGGGTDGNAADVTLGDADATFDDVITLGPEAGFVATADTITVAGNDATFNGPTDADGTDGDAESLTVNTFDNATQVTPGPFGTTRFNAVVGGNEALGSLVTDAGSANGRTEFASDAATVNAETLIEFNDEVRIIRDVAGVPDVRFRGSSAPTDAATVRFNNLLDGDVDGTTPTGVTVDATTTEFNGQVGSQQPLDTLRTTDGGGPDLTLINAAPTTSPAADSIAADVARFDDPVELADETAITTTTSTTFNNTVVSSANERNDLAVNAPTTTFEDTVGGTVENGPDALGNLTTDDNTGGGDVTTINGGAVTTFDDQTYNDPVELGAGAAGGPTEATTTLLANDVTFNSTVDEVAGAADSQELLVDTHASPNDTTNGIIDAANPTGVTAFNGEVGGNNPLFSVTTDADGETHVAADITADGASQTYNDPFVLTDNVILTETTSGNVTFNNTVDDSVAGEHTLTVNTTGGGDTVFNGEAGGNIPVGRITTDAPGETIVRGGLVRTSGAGAASGDQTYNDRVLVNEADNATGSTDFEGVNVAFNAAPDALDAEVGSAAGETLGEDVAVTASNDITFLGDVGANNDNDGAPDADTDGAGDDDAFINNFTLTAGGSITTQNVATAGNQSYAFEGKMNANGDYLTDGGDISFDGDANNDGGTGQLILDEADGTVRMDTNDDDNAAGTTGDSTGNSGNLTLTNLAVSAADDAGAGGTRQLQTLAVDTSSNDAAAGDVRLTAFNNADGMGGTIDHANAVTVDAGGSSPANDGTTTLTGDVQLDDNTTGTAAQFDVDGDGNVVIDHGGPGNQPLVIDTETGDDANGGPVNLALSSVSGDAPGQDLTIDTSVPTGTGGAVTFGPVNNDGGAFLHDLTVTTTGGTAAGVTSLSENISIDDDNAGAPGSVTMTTNLQLTDAGLTIDTEQPGAGNSPNGGSVDLSGSALSATAPDASLTVRTSAATPGAGGFGGDVQLGEFGGGGAAIAETVNGAFAANFLRTLTVVTTGDPNVSVTGNQGETTASLDILLDDNGSGTPAGATLLTDLNLADADGNATVRIDTQQDANGDAGGVQLAEPIATTGGRTSVVYGATGGMTLVVDTSTGTGAGGDVALGRFEDNDGQSNYVQSVTVNAGGSAGAGTTTLHEDVLIEDGTGPASFTITGGGPVNLADNDLPEVTLTRRSPGVLTVDTNADDAGDSGPIDWADSAVTMTGGSQTRDVTLDTSTGGANGGNVDFGPVTGSGGNFINDLRVDTTAATTDGRTTLDANVQLDTLAGPPVDLASLLVNGRLRIDAQPVTVDTESGNDADGGTVDLSGASTFAEGAGDSLTINTASAGNAGGAVDLGPFGNDGGGAAFVHDLTVVTAAGGNTPAPTRLHDDVRLDDDGAGNGGDLTVNGNGDVIVSKGGSGTTLTVDTEQGDDGPGGDVDFNASNVYADADGQDVLIETATTSGGGDAAGDVSLAVIDDNAGNASFIDNLTVTTLGTAGDGSEDGTVTLTGGAVTTDRDQIYEGPVRLAADTTLTTNGVNADSGATPQPADAGDVRFLTAGRSTVNTAAGAANRVSLAVNTGGDGLTVFNAEVGGIGGRELSTLTTNADGTTFLNADLTTVGGTQTYNDPVKLGPPAGSAAPAVAGVTLTDTGATGITFNSTVDTSAPATDVNLTVTVNPNGGHGDLEFVGAVGGSKRIGDLTVTNANDVRARSTVTATSVSQNAGTGDTRIDGQVDTSGRTGVNGGAAGDIDLATNGFIALLGGARADGANTTNGRGGDLTVQPDADSGGALPNAGPNGLPAPENEAAGSQTVDGLDPLDVAMLDGMFQLRGAGSGRGGVMTVSPTGRNAAPGVATVVGRPGAAGGPISVTARSFLVGQDTAGNGAGNEKLSTFDDVTVTTTDPGGAAGPPRSGDISVGDMSVFGSITFAVPADGPGGAQIEIQTRTPAQTLAFTGRTQSDLGVDLIARDQIDVSETPVEVPNTGQDAQPIFASPGGDHDPTGDAGLLSSYINRDFGNFNRRILSLGPVGGLPVGTPLDLTTEQPSIANVAEAIAGAIPTPETTGEIFEDTGVGQAQSELLRELGIIPRDLSSPELLWLLAGRSLYNDLDGGVSADTRRIAARRLDYEAVQRVLQVYRELFYERKVDEETGQRRLVSRKPQMRTAISDAFSAFQDTGETFSGSAFIGFLEGKEQHAEALRILRGLNELMSRVDNLALSGEERAAVQRRVFGYVLPDGMSHEQVAQAVDAAGAAPAQ